MRVRTFFNVYIDETGIKVQGKQFWIWIFTTLTTTFFVIRKSRHCKVVKEVLGENFKGVINCDGWETYKTYKKRNNCKRSNDEPNNHMETTKQKPVPRA